MASDSTAWRMPTPRSSILVTDEEDGVPVAADLADFPKTLLLKRDIPYCQDFVNNENLGFEVRSDGECQSDVHAAGIALHGHVQERLNLGEGNDRVEFPGYLSPGHAEDGAIQVDVLSPSQLLVEPNTDLKKAADSPSQGDPSRVRLSNPAEDLQQGRLACPIATDDPNNFSGLDLERDVLQGPVNPRLPSRFLAPATQSIQGRAHALDDCLTQRPVSARPARAEGVTLAQIIDGYCRFHGVGSLLS